MIPELLMWRSMDTAPIGEPILMRVRSDRVFMHYPTYDRTAVVEGVVLEKLSEYVGDNWLGERVHHTYVHALATHAIGRQEGWGVGSKRIAPQGWAPLPDYSLLPEPVKTKVDFVGRYSRGEFGNASPTWDSLDHMAEQAVLEFAPDDALYHIRNRITGAQTWYNVAPEDLADVWYQQACKKFDESQLYISEMAPTPLTLIQGEVMRDVGGLYLCYSTVPKPMRDSLKEGGREAKGLTALGLLRGYLNHNSYNWLEGLLEWYPDHVVEFSCYAKQWGTVPGHNTVFWEVRQY